MTFKRFTDFRGRPWLVFVQSALARCNNNAAGTLYFSAGKRASAYFYSRAVADTLSGIRSIWIQNAPLPSERSPLMYSVLKQYVRKNVPSDPRICGVAIRFRKSFHAIINRDYLNVTGKCWCTQSDFSNCSRLVWENWKRIQTTRVTNTAVHSLRITRIQANIIMLSRFKICGGRDIIILINGGREREQKTNPNYSQAVGYKNIRLRCTYNNIWKYFANLGAQACWFTRL